MTKVAVIGIVGESVFLRVNDFGVTGETTVATNLHTELGGKGFNQAVAAARFGASVSFLAAVNEKDVKPFTRVSEKCGVKAFLLGKKDRTSYATITTDKKGDNRVCVYRGATLEKTDVALFAKEIENADVLLLNNEVPVSVNEAAVEIAKENGVKVLLNPAPKREYDEAFLKKIDLFTPNEHETAGLENFGNVVVTLGAKGCFIKSTGELIPAQKMENVVDTTGAGDVFSGVLATCAFDGDLRSACISANKASAVKVTRNYVLDGIPYKEETEKR